MRVIGVRELMTHLSEVLAGVEAGEVVEVTNHGRAVARIVPTQRQPTPEEIAESLARMERLAEEIGRYALPGVSAEQIINEIRR